jgi:hypothetical protein
MDPRPAIDAYHELLDDELAGESDAQLRDQLSRRGLYFGERPLSSVLRPRFLTPAQYRLLRQQTKTIVEAWRVVYDRALADETFRRQFRLEWWEEELIADDHGFSEPSPVSRVDAFFTADGTNFFITEYNAETPAAASYNDVLGTVFLGLPVMRPFLRRWEVRPQPARHQVLHALLGAYREWAGRRERPRIAILDWREVPTYSEFVISAEFFRSQGLECVIADPREVEYRNGRLHAEGMQIDLIYKRVLITELVERGGLDHPVIRAVRDGAVCMVNPFRCKILHKKAGLAVLSDEQNAGLFSPAQQEAIDAHIPWTRLVEERRTLHRGREVDLVEHIAANREHFVLKPNDEYGGKGIVLGWTVDADAWRAAVEAAVAEPTIVQQRIELPVAPYPSFVDGRLVVAERIEDTAPFVFHGDYVEGCLTRLSTESLVNVTAGGGSSVATFVVAPR